MLTTSGINRFIVSTAHARSRYIAVVHVKLSYGGSIPFQDYVVVQTEIANMGC